MRPLQIGIDGAGKIAREQHIPAIRSGSAFSLAGCSHCAVPIEGVPNYADLASMLDACPQIDAVAICSPPQAHYQAARLALHNGKHVLLEKPPCSTVPQLEDLVQLAARREITLFQTWHFRETGGAEAMQRWLLPRKIQRGRIDWREDVRQWHPGQTWLWQPDGFGVFDAGINALSLISKFSPGPILVRSAELVVPSNCPTPIAAKAALVVAGSAFAAEFEFRHHGETVWEIELETDDGTARLAAHRNALIVDGREVFVAAGGGEYSRLYDRFAQLIRQHQSDVDERPLQLVADMFRVGTYTPQGPFEVF